METKGGDFMENAARGFIQKKGGDFSRREDKECHLNGKDIFIFFFLKKKKLGLRQSKNYKIEPHLPSDRRKRSNCKKF